jgi:hypothetical protein
VAGLCEFRVLFLVTGDFFPDNNVEEAAKLIEFG